MSKVMLLVALAAGPELEHCRVGGIAFTSENVGWAFDYCGRIFGTTDGGTTWATDEKAAALLKGGPLTTLAIGAATPDGSVLVGGYLGRQVLRRSQRQEWASVAVPSDQWFYAVSTVGDHAWICGSSGEVLHGEAFGARWTRTKASPTNGSDRCISLSFLDARRGWVGGWYGHLFETSDGGRSWRALRLPSEFASSRNRANQTLDRVFRVNENVGFVAGPSGTWRTKDGGKRWTKVPEVDAATARAVSLADGRRLIVSAASTPLGLEAWEPVLDLDVSPRGKGSVANSDPLIRYYGEDGKLSRVGRITGKGSGEQPNLATVWSAGTTTRYALGTLRAFRSDDSGVSWFELGPLPGNAQFVALAFANERTAVARAKGGGLFVSDDSGASWRTSTNPSLDAYDLARVSGATAAEPLRCLRAKRGKVTVAYGARGCFGGTRSTLALEWDPSGGTLSASFDTQARQMAPSEKKVSAGDARDLLGRFAGEVSRPEIPSLCTSTTAYFADIDVGCELDGQALHETVNLSTHDCNPGEKIAVGVGASTSHGGASTGYARAIGVYDLVKGIADSMPSR